MNTFRAQLTKTLSALRNINVWRVLTTVLIMAPLAYTFPNQMAITMMIGETVTNLNTAIGLVTLLLQLPFLLTLVAIMVYAKWYNLGWFIYGRRNFKKYVKQQNARIDFLVTCGTSLPVAISSIINELAEKFERVYTSTDRSMDDQELKNYEEYFKVLSDRLKTSFDEQNTSIEDQRLSLQCMRKFLDHSRKALDIQFRDLIV